MAPLAQGSIVGHKRLLAAADVLLRGIDSPQGLDARVRMYVGTPRFGGSLPGWMFTPEELSEAIGMLIRMGLVPIDPPPRRDGSAPAGQLNGGAHP